MFVFLPTVISRQALQMSLKSEKNRALLSAGLSIYGNKKLARISQIQYGRQIQLRQTLIFSSKKEGFNSLRQYFYRFMLINYSENCD
jgi:hypothetical protein